jgi:hypothetical protein
MSTMSNETRENLITRKLELVALKDAGRASGAELAELEAVEARIKREVRAQTENTVGIVLYGQDGRKEFVSVKNGYDNTSHMGGTGRLLTTRMMQLRDGSRLNFIDENTFEIVETGEILTTTPPRGKLE